VFGWPAAAGRYVGVVEKKKIISFPNLDDAIKNSLENTRPGNTLFILPNYSAMLETRKILTGKKIL